ncbi:helix-turn-helix domain-containing protein [Burkholderiaceae bacterium FT117]|uniref:helix-turn-helix transcriptional regulator n=1 Tax=Zeimonas sediminis TaxID=2944268 RepID=UPI002342F1A3|nr:helix-turn-helix domain-containing protein [Zeimonas sediminis]MCM5570476.1 helix-turn-helix domain-containing protein [Zeimonas sediminis]
MPNIAKALREEITRLARKEIRASLLKSKSALALQHREIAKLKAEVIALKRQVGVLERGVKRDEKGTPAGSAPKQVRFVPKGLAPTRKRLGLSAAALAKMMGVSTQTIYNWERGVTKPRPEQVEKLASLRGVGKREVQARLATV